MSPTPLRRLGAGAVTAAFLSAALCSGAVPIAPTFAFAEDTKSDSAQGSSASQNAGSPAPENTTDSQQATDAAATTPSPQPAAATGEEPPAAQAAETAPTQAEESASKPEQSSVATPAEAPITGVSGNAGKHWPLAITEINGDNVGKDLYEYVEVTNTTDQPINLTEQGIQLRYHGEQWDEGDVQPLVHLTGEDDSPAVIPAGGVAVFWMNYKAEDERRGLSKDEFREFYKIDQNVQIFRFGEQEGFRNAGERGFSLTDKSGKTLVRAWVPKDDGDSKTHWNAQFKVPDEIGSVDSVITEYDITGATAKPTPGSITIDQVTSKLAEPTDPTSPTEPTTPTVIAGNSGNAGKHWPLAITEINGDNVGDDNFEYLEVTNTTDQPIDLEQQGIDLRYHTSKWNAGTVQPLIHLTGEDDSPAVIPAGGVAVFWMNYASGDARQQLTKQQFREFYGVASDVQVFRFGPQKGFANGGDRGFSLTDKSGKTLVRAWVPKDDGDSKTHWNAQFKVPDEIGSVDSVITEYDITGATAKPTPGSITIDQVTSKLVKPTDANLKSPVLQITELAPDTRNVNGSDGFEFIEIYNASNAPVNFGDYTLNYFRTDNNLKNPVAEAPTLWPAGPGEPVIEAGGTLVFWIQNPAVLAANLTVADFNKEFGTNLTLGKDLLTIKSAGMANGGSRGLQIMTKSGQDVSRAYYFTDDQTTATTAIQYAWNPENASPLWSPADPTGAVQTMLGLDKPTPGRVTEAQVNSSLSEYPASTSAPTIVNETNGSEAPSTENIDLVFKVTSPQTVRRVTLTVTDNLGKSEQHNLTQGAENLYSYTIPKVNLFGKRWIEYSLTATDGQKSSSLEPVRVALNSGSTDPLRLNVANEQFVNGSTTLVATSETGVSNLGLKVDGSPVTSATPSLERAPKFAIEATDTDAFFRNGIKLGEKVLKIFDEGFYERTTTVDTDVPVGEIVPGKPVTIGVYAGTKAWPNPDVNENNDDFSFANPRLALPDGRVLTPVSCAGAGEVQPYREIACPASPSERINLSDDDLVYYLATFNVPQDAFNSVSYQWDTTAVADGAHVIEATADAPAARAAGTAGAVTRTVVVDNTAPAITSTIEDEQQYRGDFTIEASATDAGAGVDTVSATLDGEKITLPYDTSSLKLSAGKHKLVMSSADKVGNVATKNVTFTTPKETPTTTLKTPENGATVEGDKVTLEAQPVLNPGDLLNVCFVEGFAFTPADTQVTAATGTTTNAGSTDRSEATPLSEADLKKLTGTDGVKVEETSATALPYQLFTVQVPSGAEQGADARVKWSGSANADAKVLLYVQTEQGSWEEVDRYLTTGGASTDFTLNAQVAIAGHAKNDKLTFLVQHSEGWSATDRSTRDSQVTPFHADATPRSDYDFTLAWESDTQYYNKNEDQRAGTGGADTWYKHQLNIHDFVLKQRDNLNIQYMSHTGDIVDSYNVDSQWQNANDAYQRLDDAGLPYGVLAGNHDVGHFEGDYSNYGTYFGEARFNKNPWYGGSYKNNRGHYDLVSADGVDLMMIYMGWPDPNNEVSNSADIAWLNSVIKQYPERKVILNLHEYMLTTGGLGPFPQRIMDEVVATNPNVIAVGSGHYHDAYTRQDKFDDNGDGVADRTVYSMLFDYQGLPEGGQGFLRLLHFDNKTGQILVRTYSPSLDRFNSDEPSLNDPAGMQEFAIPYAAGGITPTAKTLATDSFTADILTSNQIGCAEGAAQSGARSVATGVKSGETASVTWNNVKPGQHSWYVKTTGPYGGVEYSEVRTFTAKTADAGTENGGNQNGGGQNGGNQNGGDGTGNNGNPAVSEGGSVSKPLARTGSESLWPTLTTAAAVTLAGLAIALLSRRKRSMK